MLFFVADVSSDQHVPQHRHHADAHQVPVRARRRLHPEAKLEGAPAGVHRLHGATQNQKTRK